MQHLQQSDDEFSCPFCRHTFNVENVDYLPDNVMLLRKVMEFTNHQPANSQGPLAYSESNYSTALYGLYCTILNLFTINCFNYVVCDREVNWCLTCQTTEQFACSSSGHFSIPMSIDAITNLEPFLVSDRNDVGTEIYLA